MQFTIRIFRVCAMWTAVFLSVISLAFAEEKGATSWWSTAPCSICASSLPRVEDNSAISPKDTPIQLFNGKNFDGLYTWLEDTKYEDPRNVFTVEDGMIHISGDGMGYIGTKNRYKNYHLVLEYRWGERSWRERKTCARDSGIIFHCLEPDGTYEGQYMGGIEAQIFESGTGDLEFIPDTRANGNPTSIAVTVEAEKNRRGEYDWKKGGQRMTFQSGRLNWFGHDPDWKNDLGYRGKQDIESPGQEWTRLDVICDGDHILYYVNGILATEGFDARPSSGKITIQCELAEIYVRRFELLPLNKKAEPTTLKSPVKVGIIGLDAHALDWTKILNEGQSDPEFAGVTVVAGYPGGSPDIPESMDYLHKNVEPICQMGVEIVDSIDALIGKVDAVMILSIDGRAHLPQAKPVFAAGKPVFIDKPIAASLAEAIEIYRLAREHKTPCFSSSSLRFAPGTQAVRNDPQLRQVRGCDAFSPCPLEPHHPDLFWYGIHGVETLFTIMGPGCQSVACVQTEVADVATGAWEDGRIGTFRGRREDPHAYGATVFTKNGIVQAGRFEGYEPLVAEIVKFFRTGRPPVTVKETLEILAFMEAADQSKRNGGCPVTIESIMQQAQATKQ